MSIIIVIHNTEGLILRNLDSLTGTGELGHIELLVIDNGSTDGSVESIRRRFPEVNLVQSENIGFAKAVNLGMKKTSGNMVLVLNGDVVLTPEDVRRMGDVYSRLDSPGVLGVRQFDEKERLCLTWGRFPTVFSEIRRKKQQERLRLDPEYSRATAAEITKVSEVDWVSGSCWYYSRNVFEKSGPLDENYFLFFEDVDWCGQVRKQGFHNYYDPTICVLHGHGKSAEQNPVVAEVSYRESQIYFCRKHFSSLSVRILKSYLKWKYRRRPGDQPGSTREEARRRIAEILR